MGPQDGSLGGRKETVAAQAPRVRSGQELRPPRPEPGIENPAHILLQRSCNNSPRYSFEGAHDQAAVLGLVRPSRST
jgi:hypothetical protein